MTSKKLYILHDFDGRPYYKALELNYEIVYLNTRPFRFMVRDIIKYQKINKDTIRSLVFLLKLPFLRNKRLILAMAPYNYRILFYGWLYLNNTVIYHTSWPKWADKTPFLTKWEFIKTSWNWFIRKFHDRVAVSNEANRSLSKFINYYPVTTISHVVDSPPITIERFNHKWVEESLNIGYMGRLDAEKGIETYISLSNEFIMENNIRFFCAGKGTLQGNVEENTLINDNFIYEGYLQNRKLVAKFFEKLHFLILPSIKQDDWEELFGIVIIEAMRQGVVVIATNHCGPREIIQNTENGYIFEEINFKSDTMNLIKKNQLSGKNTKKMVAENALKNSELYSLHNVSNKWNNLLNEK